MLVDYSSLSRIKDVEIRDKVKAKLDSKSFRTPPVPKPPCLSASAQAGRDKARAIQRYISAFQYNHTGEEFFQKKKGRGFRHLSLIAKEIMREGLPIQCVEAVFLAAFLTCELKHWERYPVSFKSTVGDQVYRHVVLALHDTKTGKWGSLGLSRRSALMYKELQHPSLSALVANFNRSYTACWHELQSCSIGLPLPHDASCNEAVVWEAARVQVAGEAWEDVSLQVEKRVRECLTSLDHLRATGRLPPKLKPAGSGESRALASGGEAKEPEKKAATGRKKSKAGARSKRGKKGKRKSTGGNGVDEGERRGEEKHEEDEVEDENVEVEEKEEKEEKERVEEADITEPPEELEGAMEERAVGLV